MTRSGPLADLRVVELTTAWSGPMAGRILAFLGAEVVHVESSTKLDNWRLHGEPIRPARYPGGVGGARPYNRAAFFNSQNINKLSLSVNLKSPDGCRILQGLLEDADILLCNYTPGALRRLGLDFDTIRECNPGLVTLEMPAFGSHGPHSNYKAMGPTMEASAGFGSLVGYGDGAPSLSGTLYCDPLGGFNGAAAVLTALAGRDRTGKGDDIEMSQVEAAMQVIGEALLDGIETGQPFRPTGNRVPYAAPHDSYHCAGGEDEWVAIAIFDDADWQRFCDIAGFPELADDPRYATQALRRANQDALREPITAWTAGLGKFEVAELLQSADIAAAPVMHAKDVFESAYLRERGYFTALGNDEVGKEFEYPGMPFRLESTPGGQYRHAPALGQDNDYVLRHILNLSDDEISALDVKALSAVPEPQGKSS
jgi:crotonobetainyl-CoA:carnitine CoA-transferase CaiB-like acyl-CoA transferase